MCNEEGKEAARVEIVDVVMVGFAEGADVVVVVPSGAKIAGVVGRMESAYGQYRGQMISVSVYREALFLADE